MFTCFLKGILGCEIATQLVFVHIFIFSYCDSTSRLYGIGKMALFQKTNKNYSLIRACAEIFTIVSQDALTILGPGFFFPKEKLERLETLKRHHLRNNF